MRVVSIMYTHTHAHAQPHLCVPLCAERVVGTWYQLFYHTNDEDGGRRVMVIRVFPSLAGSRVVYVCFPPLMYTVL